MRIVGYLAIFIGGLVACYLLMSLGVVDKWDGIPGAQREPEISLPTYLSFVGVMLTAVTTVMTALAIGIGIIAAYTFKELKDQAKVMSREISESTAKTIASEALSEVKVKAMVFELYAKAEQERQQRAEWGDDPKENEER